MAVAKVMTTHLLGPQLPSPAAASPADTSLFFCSAPCRSISNSTIFCSPAAAAAADSNLFFCSAPCRSISNSTIFCSSFQDATTWNIGTLRTRGLSAASRGLSVRTPFVASKDASTSTLLAQEVEFTWKGQGSEVLLTGDFLNWEEKLALEKSSNDVFSLKQKLASGRYSYKFIVDGEWKHSPDSPTVSDGTGGFNNELIVADQSAIRANQDSENASQAQSPLPTNNKTIGEKSAKPPLPTNNKTIGEKSAKPSPRPIKRDVEAKTLEETMSENVIPLLSSALRKGGITDVDVTFEDNQLKTSFGKENIRYCFWVFFPDGVLEGSRGSSLTSHGSPPSTIEPFLVDEKKITAELLVFWIKKRLFAQQILSLN